MSRPRSIRIPSRRRRSLAAIIHGPLGGPATAVIAHGMLSDKRSSRHRDMARALAARGIASIRFDFAGRGTSAGDWRDLTPTGELDDLLGVLDWAVARGAGPLALVGSSLGGAICIMAAAADRRVEALATWAAVGDFTTVPRWNHPALIARWRAAGAIVHEGERVPWSFLEQAHGIDLTALAATITVPALIAHGTRDEVVPVSQAHQLASALPDARLMLIADADHRLIDTTARANVIDVMADFIAAINVAKILPLRHTIR